jgi:pyruvate dehydrogenase E2 component (dihydrolipoamide acetyltransferase)
METGTLLQWFKEEGEKVEIGEPLFEIMTDKINIEVEAYDEGILLKKYVEVDEQTPVNQIIAYIGKSGEKVPDTLQESEEEKDLESTTTEFYRPGKDQKVRATPAARMMASQQQIGLQDVYGSGPNNRVQKRDVLAFTKEDKQKISPLANKVAKANNIDLTNIEGSGIHGKILRKDIKFGQIQDQTPEHQSSQTISSMRKVIAERMATSLYTAPHVTLNTEVEMSKVKEMRVALLPVIEKQTGYRLSYTEIIIKACAIALKKHKNINVSLIDNQIINYQNVHIGLAVAVKDGLIVPVIKDAAGKGIAEITCNAKELSMLAHENKLKPTQMQGSTFTISNLGMYAIDAFTPIINQPESAILGVGRIHEKPVAINGNLEIRPMMTLSLSFDHRVLDGAPAAEFLTEIKSILENPYEIMV